MLRMVQRREDLRFALETRQAIGITGEGIGQDLERDVALQLRVLRAIDLAHPAGADLGGDLVDAEAGAWGKGQKGRLGLYGAGGSPDGITPEDALAQCCRRQSSAAKPGRKATVHEAKWTRSPSPRD